MQRFNPSTAAMGINPTISTLEAAQILKEEEQKRLARAQKFGLQTQETEQQKLQQRAVKFGLVASEKDQASRKVTATLNIFPP